MEVYVCPICKQGGFPSIYVNGCTSCANTVRFGCSNPTPIDIENAHEVKWKLGLNDWEYAKYKQRER